MGPPRNGTQRRYSKLSGGEDGLFWMTTSSPVAPFECVFSMSPLPPPAAEQLMERIDQQQQQNNNKSDNNKQLRQWRQQKQATNVSLLYWLMTYLSLIFVLFSPTSLYSLLFSIRLIVHSFPLLLVLAATVYAAVWSTTYRE